MKRFMKEDFLLDTKTARTLYEKYAKDQPIFDFHCHLNPKEIYDNKIYKNLTEVWLGGDHYKWRLLREYGVSEEYITGGADDYEKFLKYAEVIPYAIGNPIYEWTHLELKRYFGIDEVLSPSTAKSIWDRANEKLKTFGARDMITANNVKHIFTTDDPVDDLKYNKLIKEDAGFTVSVLPTFRPDKAINIERETFAPWLILLESVTGKKTETLADLLKGLESRVNFFDEAGCCCSDHALDAVVYETATEKEVAEIFEKAKKKPLTESELAKYKGFILAFLGRLYHKKGWVQQYHIGALRNNSTRNYKLLGPDTGYDAINDRNCAAELSKLLDSMDKSDELPKTVLYCLNPRDNETLATIMNCFQGAGVAGKIQFGSAWWFNDQADGMERQLTALMHLGLISKFIGMLTDSRSFLSYTRHEYFRRILCNMLGDLIEKGKYPNDTVFVGEIVKDVCYRNALDYFKK